MSEPKAANTDAKALSKSQIIAEIAESQQMTKKQASDILEAIAALAAREVKDSPGFTFPGIGKFKLQTSKERTGTDPKTGEPRLYPAKTKLKATFQKAFKEATGIVAPTPEA